MSNLLLYFFADKIWFSVLYSVFPPLLLLLGYIISAFIIILVVKKYWQVNKSLNLILLATIIPNLLFFTFFTEINLGFLRKDKILTGDELTIFNWNTEFWEEDRPKLYSFLKEQNADIYQLQERLTPTSIAGEFDEIDDLKEIKELFPNYNIAAHSEYITISKFPIKAVVYSEANSFLRTDISINNEIISFYNVHIPVHIDLSKKLNIKYLLTNTPKRFTWRKEEFQKLEEDLDTNSNKKYISGDFNSIRSMKTMSNLLDKYTDSIYYSNQLFPRTWALFGVRGWRIDYNFSDKNIEILKHVNIDPIGLSDHWGQKIYIKI